MTTKVRHLLKSFDALPDPEKHQAVVEILRRAPVFDDVPDAGLADAADQLFQAMDQAEAENAAS